MRGVCDFPCRDQSARQTLKLSPSSIQEPVSSTSAFLNTLTSASQQATMSKNTLLCVCCLILVGCCLVVATAYEPDEGYGEDQHKHHKHKHPAFWEILMANPYGVPDPQEPRCDPSFTPCVDAKTCCSGSCEDFRGLGNECCVASGGPAGLDCCSGLAVGGDGGAATCCDPLLTTCSDPSTCCSGGCEDLGLVARGGTAKECCQPSGQNCPAISTGRFDFSGCCNGRACVGNKCCDPLGAACEDAATCCSDACEVPTLQGRSGKQCCSYDVCEVSEDCCGDGSINMRAYDVFCDTDEKTCVYDDECIGANTLVHVRESQTGSPIPIEELQTGQHVLCLDTSEDARLPTKTKWCKVHAWLHAGTRSRQHVRINTVVTSTTSKAVSGGVKNTTGLTVTPNHLVMRLTAPHVTARGSTVASVEEFGQFESVAASAIKAGDTLAVLADAANPTAGGFRTVSVTSVEQIEEKGFYTPVIDSPYIIAHGFVAPTFKCTPRLLAAPPGTNMQGAQTAVQHYLMSPLYMQHFAGDNAVGIAGKDAKVAATRSRAAAIKRAMKPFVEGGKALNYEVVRGWWQPRYAAFTASNRAQTVSVDDVVALLQSESTWVQPSADTVARVAGDCVQSTISGCVTSKKGEQCGWVFDSECCIGM